MFYLSRFTFLCLTFLRFTFYILTFKIKNSKFKKMSQNVTAEENLQPKGLVSSMKTVEMGADW